MLIKLAHFPLDIAVEVAVSITVYRKSGKVKSMKICLKVNFSVEIKEREREVGRIVLNRAPAILRYH